MDKPPPSEIDRRKSDLLAQVSHELKTPLTSIRNFADLMQRYDDLEPETRSRYLGNIISEVDRLRRLINDLLDLSKIEAGRSEWRMTRVEMASLVRSTLERLEPLASQAEVSLHADAPPAVPVVLGDTDRLVQVLTNLVGNALKFTEAGGTVTVSVEADERDVRVSVADTGIGIPETQLGAVFDKFVQVKRPAGGPIGTGLGLPIAREIVEAHGGEISVSSVPGEGTTFRFRLGVCEGLTPFEAYLRWRIGYARSMNEPFAVFLFGAGAPEVAREAAVPLATALEEALRTSDAVLRHDRSDRIAAFVSVDAEQQLALLERLRSTLERSPHVLAACGDLPNVVCVAARYPDQAESAPGLRALLEKGR